MTYDKQALIELRDAAVGGDGDWRQRWIDWDHTKMPSLLLFSDAYNGSIDAALSLLGEVLPGTYVHEMGNDSKSMGWNAIIVSTAGLYSSSHECGEVGVISSGGCALLIAILNALIDGCE